MQKENSVDIVGYLSTLRLAELKGEEKFLAIAFAMAGQQTGIPVRTHNIKDSWPQHTLSSRYSPVFYPGAKSKSWVLKDRKDTKSCVVTQAGATHLASLSKTGVEPERTQVTKKLSDLVQKIKDPQERLFLEEAIRCYQVGAYRATVVMLWVLTMDHLQKHILSDHLSEFNKVLATHGDKKMKSIGFYDDFSELKETRVIELIRNAGIISNDVRKILDEKLGIRNSAGHPSGVTISGHKTTEFALDLIENVLLKY